MNEKFEKAIKEYAITEEAQYKLKRLVGRLLQQLAEERAKQWRVRLLEAEKS